MSMKKSRKLARLKNYWIWLGWKEGCCFMLVNSFLEGHLKCVSGYPRDLACCYLQLPFEDENVNTNIVIVPVIMLGMTITRGFF